MLLEALVSVTNEIKRYQDIVVAIRYFFPSPSSIYRYLKRASYLNVSIVVSSQAIKFSCSYWDIQRQLPR